MKWYQTTWACILFLFLFFPLGLFLMWKYQKRWPIPVKTGISTVFAFFLVFSLVHDPLPKSLALSGETEPVLDIGETLTYEVTYEPEQAIPTGLIGISDQVNIASITISKEEDGIFATVTAQEEGQTAIRVQCGKVSSSPVVITVIDQDRLWQEQADDVDVLIENLGTITPDSESDVAAVRAAYDALDPEAQAYVANLKTLEEAENALADFANAQAVTDEIDALGTITADSKEAVETARSNYDALSEEAQKLVTNLKTLEKAESTLKTYADAQAVTDEIDALGTITADSKKAVETARSHYDKLSESSQKLVTNVETLEKAERILSNIKKAKTVSDMIESMDAQSESEISEARKAYDDLPDGAKKRVTNYEDLTAAEDWLEEQKAAEKAAEEAAKEETVYWVPNGKSYHSRKTCRTLSRSKTILSGTLSEAIAAGKDDPCDVCH